MALLGCLRTKNGRHILVQGQLLSFHTYFLFLVICTTAHSSVGWLGTAERFSWPHVVAQWCSGSWMEPPEGWTRPTSKMEHPCRQQLVLVVSWEPSVSCRWEESTGGLLPGLGFLEYWHMSSEGEHLKDRCFRSHRWRASHGLAFEVTGYHLCPFL